MENKKIKEVKELLEKDLVETDDLKVLDDLRVKYLGKKGLITELNSEIKNIPNEEKKEFGMLVNELRNTFKSSVSTKSFSSNSFTSFIFLFSINSS